jgi:hypothetical protein
MRALDVADRLMDDFCARTGVDGGGDPDRRYLWTDALAVEERVLELRRRVLPADHPDIGEGCEGRDGLHAV